MSTLANEPLDWVMFASTCQTFPKESIASWTKAICVPADVLDWLLSNRVVDAEPWVISTLVDAGTSESTTCKLAWPV